MPKLTAIRKQALDEMMKTALLEATVAVLGEHGLDGMTMDRVAAAAGVAKGSLYHYFSSKRDLLEFVYTKTVEPIFQDLENILASDQSATEKLAAHTRTLLEQVAKHARVFQLLFEDDSVHGLLQSSERSVLETASQRMVELFRQGIAEGVFRPADPLMLAKMYIGLCKGVLDTKPDLKGRDEQKQIQDLILSTFLNGIVTEKGRVK